MGKAQTWNTGLPSSQLANSLGWAPQPSTAAGNPVRAAAPTSQRVSQEPTKNRGASQSPRPPAH